MATRVQEGGGGMGSSGGFKAKAVRVVGGITGKGGKNVTPPFKETGASVKVITPGTKPLTKPNVPYHINALRSPSELKRMGL